MVASTRRPDTGAVGVLLAEPLERRADGRHHRAGPDALGAGGCAADRKRTLPRYRRELLGLKREYEVKLAALADITVYALTAELVYLTTDMSIFVDGYFLKQDIRWTDADAAAFSAQYLRTRHQSRAAPWEPAEPIKAAIDKAGARLVVLDTGDTGSSRMAGWLRTATRGFCARISKLSTRRCSRRTGKGAESRERGLPAPRPVR